MLEMNRPRELARLTTRTTTLAGFASAAGEQESDVGSPLARGENLARYVILGCLGVGGMGVVYAAYDPQLDRKIAVKVLRQRFFSDADGGTSRRRLLREAQALARLAHPNVVAVFDAGVIDGPDDDDQIFVAMEFVAGRDLREWSRVERRSWRDTLRIYRQAGRGLAAAHDAGLVHRDFKPDNVIVGDDGRVRVLDFGLARPAAATDGEPPDSEARFGTPAYMAPEQLDGRAADARSDQYSFCCALYEALYGETPFGGEKGAERQAAKRRGELREPPAGAGVPAWIQSALERGLEPRPENRHSSMQALLQVLGRDPAKWRRGIVGAATVAALALALGSGWQAFTDHQARFCRDAGTHLAGIWDDPRRQAIHQAFLLSRVDYATTAYRYVAETLDDYTNQWIDMRTEACEATHLRGEQSPELLDLRMSCLDRRLQEVAAAVDLLQRADAVVVERAAQLSDGLSSLATCADAARLKAVVQLPADPTVAEKVAEIRELLARARASQLAGQTAEGLELARDAAARSEPSSYPPLLAEARLHLGFIQLALGDFKAADATLRESWRYAEAGRHDEVKISAIFYLAWSTISQRLGFEAGWERLAIADGVIRGLGDPENLRIYWHYAASYLYQAAGRLDQAAVYARQAAAGSRALLGEDHLTVADYTHQLGSVLVSQGRLEEALEHLLDAERIRRRALGDEHPKSGLSYQALGRTYLELGLWTEAGDKLQQAHRLLAQSFGPESREAITVIHDLGTIDIHQGRYQQALARHRQALTIRRRLQDPYEAARSLNMIGLALTRSGRLAEAEAALSEALSIAETTRDAEDPVLAHYLINLAELRIAGARYSQAELLLERASQLKPSAGARLEIEIRRGLVDLETGELEDARRRLEQALQKVEPSDLLDWADGRFALARTLAKLGREPDRVRALAREAGDGYSRLAGSQEKAARVRDWLEMYEAERRPANLG